MQAELSRGADGSVMWAWDGGSLLVRSMNWSQYDQFIMTSSSNNTKTT